MVESHIAIRTLIPEARSYGIAILVLLALSSFSLAADLHSRWLAGRGVGLYHAYCAVLAFAALWGLLIIRSDRLMPTSALSWILSIPLGLAIGSIAGSADRAIIRSINRRSLLHRPRGGGPPQVPARQARAVRLANIPLPGQGTRKRELGLNRVRRDYEPNSLQRDVRVWVQVAIAVLEEIVYRGLLVAVCFLLPGLGWTVLALVGTLAAFALSHLWFGWPHVLAKLPLGLLALAASLALGSVLPAVVAHVFFNFNVWRDMRAALAALSN